MDAEYLAKLCDARDTLCGFCEVDECEKCIVTHLINDAYSEMPECDGGSYTAFLYEPGGVITADLATYDTAEDAIGLALFRGWDEVVNDSTGEVIWRKS